MAHVIYNPATYKIFVFPSGNRAVYEDKRTADGQLTKLVNKGVLNDSWEVESYENYANNEPYVTVKSLMNGADVQIRLSDVGTCVDPSMERYWTM